MQVDSPVSEKSRHECSHFLRQLGNTISGDLSDIFTGAAVDVLVTQDKNQVCDELELP